MSAIGTKRTYRSCTTRTCLLSGVMRTYLFALQMSAFDPKRTSAYVQRTPRLQNHHDEKSLDRNTTGRSAWACSSKNLRDARSSIVSRNRIN